MAGYESVRLMQVFENSIYLFFTHPFDIGDEIRFEGTRYTVKSMTLQVRHCLSPQMQHPHFHGCLYSTEYSTEQFRLKPASSSLNPARNLN